MSFAHGSTAPPLNTRAAAAQVQLPPGASRRDAARRLGAVPERADVPWHPAKPRRPPPPAARGRLPATVMIGSGKRYETVVTLSVMKVC